MPDLTICPVCGTEIEGTQGECTNCGAILEGTHEKSANPVVTQAETPKDVSEKPLAQLPMWMVIRDLCAEAKKLQQDANPAPSLDLYYRVLEMAATHRRVNPAMGAVIQEVLQQIEAVEGGNMDVVKPFPVKPPLEQSPSGETIIQDMPTPVRGEAEGTDLSEIAVVDSRRAPSQPEMKIPTDTVVAKEHEPAPNSLPSPSRESPQVAARNKLTRLPVISPQNVDALVLQDTWGQEGGSLYQIAYSPNGAWLGITNNREVSLMTTSPGKPAQQLKGHLNQVFCLAFSPDSQHLATGGGDWDVKIWEVNTGKLVRTQEGHTEDVFGVVFSPEGDIIATASADHTIRLWQANSGKLLQVLTQHKDCVETLAFSPNGKLLASGADDGVLCVWRLNANAPGMTWRAHKAPIASVTFSPDGTMLASSADDGSIGLWRSSDGRSISLMTGKKDPVESLSFSPDGSLLVSGSGGGSATIWEVKTNAALCTLDHADGIHSLSFSPDGSRLAVGIQNGVVCFWGVGK